MRAKGMGSQWHLNGKIRVLDSILLSLLDIWLLVYKLFTGLGVLIVTLNLKAALLFKR